LSVFVVGYAYQIIQRIILEDGEPYLPEWEDWSKLFNDGLRLTGALLILYIPTILFSLIAILLNFLLQFEIMGSSQSSSLASPGFPSYCFSVCSYQPWASSLVWPPGL